MKKTMRKVHAFILCMLLTLTVLPAGAQAETFSTYISTPTAVQPGETFTVTLTFSSSVELSAINASVGYDSSKLEFLSSESSVAGIFSGQVGTRIIAYSTSSSSGGTFAYLKFRAKSGFSAGETTYISVSSVTGTDADLNDVTGYGASVGIRMAGSSSGGGGSESQGNQSWTPDPDEPLSDDSSLASLEITGAELSPAFSETVRAYMVKVPFETETLDIKAVPTSEKAGVSVTNNVLKAGKTTDVVITVTAENGSYTVYTVRATREQDPNYVPSDNCYLADIKIDCGKVSPVFDKDTLKYVVEVPAGTKQITIDADPEYEDATVRTIGSADLSPGRENVYHVVCTAEDGVTSRIYTVTVKVPNEYDFFLKKSYILSSQKLIRDADYGTVLDLTSAPVQILSRDIFDSLRDEENGILSVRTPGGTFTFRSADILEEDPANFYDFTILHTSDYAEKYLPSLVSYQNYVFSTHNTGLFPGLATVSVYTNYIKGQTVNVYVYVPEDSEYVYAAQNVTVGDGGTVTFDIDRGGDFIISTKDVPGTDSYHTAEKGPSKWLSGKNVYIALGVILALFGFLLGLAVSRLASKRRKKKALKKAEKEAEAEDEKLKQALSPEAPAAALTADAAEDVTAENDVTEEADDSDMNNETVTELPMPGEDEPEMPEAEETAPEEMTEEITEDAAEDTAEDVFAQIPEEADEAPAEEPAEEPAPADEPGYVSGIIPDMIAEDRYFEEPEMTPTPEYDDLSALDGEDPLDIIGEEDVTVPEPEFPDVPDEEEPALEEADFPEDELIPPGTELISAPGADEATPVKTKKKLFGFGSRRKKEELDEDMEAFEALLDKVNKGEDKE